MTNVMHNSVLCIHLHF